MIIFKELRIKTPKREVLINITSMIAKIVEDSSVKEGVCRIFVPHTTAGITINENADPAVMKDIIMQLKKIIPKNSRFSHMEGNSDSHIKSTLTGPNIEVIIHTGNLVLGIWQGIMFAEYDGPRNRKIFVQIQGEMN